MFGRFWTPPHSRVPDDFVDSNKPQLTRDPQRARAMRQHRRQERAQNVPGTSRRAELSEQTPLLQDHTAHPRLDAAPISCANGNPDPNPPPYSPDIPGRPAKGHGPSLEHTCTCASAVVGHYACHDTQADGLPDPTLPPFAPDVPGQPEKGPTHWFSPLSEPDKGVHAVYNPKDRYGIPLYHSVPAAHVGGEDEKDQEGERNNHRVGVTFLVVLALLIFGHTAQVVHSVLQDIHARQAVRAVLSGVHLTTAPKGRGDEVKCVDLQSLKWSDPIPLDLKTGTPVLNDPTTLPDRGHISGSGQTYMWLSSTHLAFPLHSPIFALFGGHVRGNIGVLGSHASADAERGQMNVLVEVKIQSSFSSKLQETGAWRELTKYDLCRISRFPGPPIDNDGATDSASDGKERTEGIDLRKHTRAPIDHDDGISFNMQILLPSADVQGSGAELYVPRMDVGVVQGDIEVDVPGVRFGKVQLWTRDGDVHLGSLRAGEVSVHRGRKGWKGY